MKNSLRVVKFLLAHKDKKFTVSQIGKELEMHRMSVWRSMLDLLVARIIKEKKGKSNLYWFNDDLL